MRGILFSLLPLAALSCSAREGAFTPEYEVSFQIDQSLTDESIGTTDVYIQLTPPSAEPVTVEVAVAGGSATEGEDFSLATSVATFDPGATTAKVSLAITADLRDEDEEELQLTLRSPQGAALGELTTHRVRIGANLLPRVRFTELTSSADENAGPQSFEVRLSKASPVDVVVAYAWMGTAEGADHGVTAGELTIPAGELGHVLLAPIIDDLTDEEDEELEIVLSTRAGAVVQSDEGRHVHTIVDDDAPPTVSFTSFSSATDEGTTAMLEVNLARASEKEIEVAFAVTGGTASADDYMMASGTLTFGAGVTTQAISLAAISDTRDEENETVNVRLSNPVNASLGTDTAHSLMIADKNAPPTLAFQVDSSTASEGAVAHTVTVALSAASGLAVQFSVAVSGGTATYGADYSLPATAFKIPAGGTSATVTVTIANNSFDGYDKTAALRLEGFVAASRGAITTHSVTIADDDAPPLVRFDPAVLSRIEPEGDLGTTTYTYRVILSAASGKTVSVEIANTGGAAATDFSFGPGDLPVVFQPGQTARDVRVIVNGDFDFEIDKTVIMTLQAATDATIAPDNQTRVHTIDNDDEHEPPDCINCCLEIGC